jgi:hypothetical protein
MPLDARNAHAPMHAQRSGRSRRLMQRPGAATQCIDPWRATHGCYWRCMEGAPIGAGRRAQSKLAQSGRMKSSAISLRGSPTGSASAEERGAGGGGGTRTEQNNGQTGGRASEQAPKRAAAAAAPRHHANTAPRGYSVFFRPWCGGVEVWKCASEERAPANRPPWLCK